MPHSIKLDEAVLVTLRSRRAGAEEWLACIEPTDTPHLALAYPALVGPLREGDRVLLNTTAVALRLGTGGAHFVVARLDGEEREPFAPDGHWIKLRYTPLQHAVVAGDQRPTTNRTDPTDPTDPSDPPFGAESQASLHGLPVIAAELHSQMAAAAIAARAVGPAGLRIAYVMSDTAALPAGWSRLAARLRADGTLAATITAGQAFGGDLEAINVHSALLAAKHVVRADLAIVAQGPGNAGTGTTFGYGGLAQGEHLNAIAALGGTPIAVLRVSLADPRPRHHGVSHHSLTVLGRVALCRCHVPLPPLPDDEASLVTRQLDDSGVIVRHDVQRIDFDTDAVLAALSAYGYDLTTMGRGVDEERAFFLAASAGGVAAVRQISDSASPRPND